MNNESHNIEELLVRILENRASDNEVLYFLEWIRQKEENRIYFEKIKKLWNLSSGTHASQEMLREGEKDYRRFMESTLKSRKLWFRWKVASVAAMVLVVLSFVFWLNQLQENIPVQKTVQVDFVQTQGVVLKMLDDEEISLLDDSLRLTDRLVKINKINRREISYELNDSIEISDNEELVYDQIIVPAGERFSVRLSDGTKAWINSESSLRFPIYFGKDFRTVETQGNVYFEVVKDSTRPFIVISNEMTTEVLGTSFEVNTYGDRGVISTTLVEGKVKVSVEDRAVEIEPNEQFVWDLTDRGFKVEKVDALNEVRWKDDILVLNNEQFEDVVRKLERWYGVSIENSTGEVFSQSFSGEFDREDIQAAIEAICVNLDISYSMVDDNRVLLKK